METSGFKLLIVDDDETLCRNLQGFFMNQKYAVEMAHDGPAALAKINTFHPDILFLDIGLPGLSGLEVLRQVKTRDPLLRVIMITAQTEEIGMAEAKNLG